MYASNHKIMTTFIDSHCHFDFVDFDQDRNALWLQAQRRGISKLLIPGVAPDQWQKAAEICAGDANMFFGVGVHPWWIASLYAEGFQQQQSAALRTQLLVAADAKQCVAIGECGLDKTIATNFSEQELLLKLHIEVAQSLAKPLIFHSVKSHSELLNYLKKYKPSAGGVIHGFSGSFELAMEFWQLGFYIGVGGTISYERAQKTRAAISKMPLAALLLETDAPDMPLQGKQGQRNSPLAIINVAQCLAQLREESLDIIAQQTSSNFCQLFGV
jgi:TatD DNase family protein